MEKDLRIEVPSDTGSAEEDFFSFLLKPTPRSITVKFVAEDESVFTQAYYEKLTVGEIKTCLVDVFAVPGPAIDLTHEGNSLADNVTLCEFNVKAYHRLELGLLSKSSKYVITAENAYKDFSNPDNITVRIETEDGFKDIVVEIEDRSIVKPFVGGFVSTETGIEYHHGYSQTGPPKPKVPPEMKNHRDTQTYFTRNRKYDTHYSRATQMTNEITWIPNINDRIFTAGPYETAEEREKRLDIEGKVRIIQRYFRAWKMRKALKILSAEYKKRVAKELEDEELNEKFDLERKKRELIAKVFPRTRADFAMLYTMVERWKKAEIERISTISCGPAKITSFYMLLEKEVEMLRSIERHREAVKKDMKIEKIKEFYKTIGTPLFWNSHYKNIPIWMDTLETQQGREFEELYYSICHETDREARIEAFLNLKLYFTGHNCLIWNELIKLVDRACELLARGLHDNHLDVLQKRIQALLTRHTQQPECNKGVTNRLTRIKEKTMEDNLFYCIRCKQLKTHDLFTINTRVEHLNVCLLCSWDDRMIEPWVDLAPYRFMLRRIRREERTKTSHSSIAFVLQDIDIYHLITQIWHSHSAINECDDMYNLILARWFKAEEWAPWNSILLTKSEAKAHLKIRKLEDVYDKEFLNFVRNKHWLAKEMFAVAFQLEKRFQEIGRVETKWSEILDSTEFVPVNSKPKIFLSCH